MFIYDARSSHDTFNFYYTDNAASIIKQGSKEYVRLVVLPNLADFEAFEENRKKKYAESRASMPRYGEVELQNTTMYGNVDMSIPIQPMYDAVDDVVVQPTYDSVQVEQMYENENRSPSVSVLQNARKLSERLARASISRGLNPRY